MKNKRFRNSKIPVQVRPREDVRAKLEKIAAVNGLSLNDVANLCLNAGLPMVETKLGEMTQKPA